MRRKLTTLAVTLVLMGVFRFFYLAATRPAKDDGPSPEQLAHMTESELARQEKEAFKPRREIVVGKLDNLARRLDGLKGQLRLAEKKFASDIDRALATPRQRAEELLQARKQYNVSEARYLAEARYASEMAGTLGALGAQPLPYPQRDFGYADALDKSSLAYKQAVRMFNSDADVARLELEQEIGRAHKDFLSLHADVLAVKTEWSDLGDRERGICKNLLALARNLGPYMTKKDVPAAPPEPTSYPGNDLRTEMYSQTEWVEQALVNSETIRSEVEAKFASPLFKEANAVVKILQKGGLP